MLNAIKQEVIVLPNGVVPFSSPELQESSRVGVDVLVCSQQEVDKRFVQSFS